MSSGTTQSPSATSSFATPADTRRAFFFPASGRPCPSPIDTPAPGIGALPTEPRRQCRHYHSPGVVPIPGGPSEERRPTCWRSHGRSAYGRRVVAGSYPRSTLSDPCKTFRSSPAVTLTSSAASIAAFVSPAMTAEFRASAQLLSVDRRGAEIARVVVVIG